MMLEERSNVPTYRQNAAELQVAKATIFFRYTIVRIFTISSQKVLNFYIYYLFQLLPLARTQIFLRTLKIISI